MIVVEGPDGAGKSSLAAKLSESLGVEIAEKAVSGEARAMVSIVKYVEGSMEAGFRRVIYDRHALISSPIYTAALRKSEPNEGFGDFRWLAMTYDRWRQIAPLVIVCLPPFEHAWKNCQKDEFNAALFPTREVLFAVYSLYFNLAARNPSILLYDYTRHDAEDLIDFVESMFKERHV